jgi:hypothetical protein
VSSAPPLGESPDVVETLDDDDAVEVVDDDVVITRVGPDGADDEVWGLVVAALPDAGGVEGLAPMGGGGGGGSWGGVPVSTA